MLSQFTKPRYLLLFRGFGGCEITQQIPPECTDSIPLLTTSKTPRRSILRPMPAKKPAKKLTDSQSRQAREVGGASFTPNVARWSSPRNHGGDRRGTFRNYGRDRRATLVLFFLGHHLIGDVQVGANVLHVVVLVNCLQQSNHLAS